MSFTPSRGLNYLLLIWPRAIRSQRIRIWTIDVIFASLW